MWNEAWGDDTEEHIKLKGNKQNVVKPIIISEPHFSSMEIAKANVNEAPSQGGGLLELGLKAADQPLQHKFVILSSDGFNDMIDDGLSVNLVASYLQDKNNNLADTAEWLTNQALRRAAYQSPEVADLEQLRAMTDPKECRAVFDDITVVVVFLTDELDEFRTNPSTKQLETQPVDCQHEQQQLEDSMKEVIGMQEEVAQLSAQRDGLQRQLQEQVSLVASAVSREEGACSALAAGATKQAEADGANAELVKQVKEQAALLITASAHSAELQCSELQLQRQLQQQVVLVQDGLQQQQAAEEALQSTKQEQYNAGYDAGKSSKSHSPLVPPVSPLPSSCAARCVKRMWCMLGQADSDDVEVEVKAQRINLGADNNSSSIKQRTSF
jgi:hypothetical protein